MRRGRAAKPTGSGGRVGNGGGKSFFRGASKRLHSRGRISKSRAVQNASVSKGDGFFRRGQQSHSKKKAKKLTMSKQQPGAQLQTHADGTLQRNREKGRLRKGTESLTKRQKKKEMWKGVSSSETPRLPGAAEGAGTAAGPRDGKTPQQRKPLHDQTTATTKQQPPVRDGKRRVEAVRGGEDGAGTGVLRESHNKRRKPPAAKPRSEGPARAADEEAAANEAENAMSVSKKRKLEKEKKLSTRNQDAGYVKQCFRLYGQLLAAPRSSREEGTSAAAPASDNEEPRQQASLDTAGSSGKRSPAVQKAAAALYDFILPRIKEKDRHLCTSRSIQMLLKYGSKEHRQVLWQLLKDEFAELCVGRNSCQLAMKLYLYGDPACQAEIVQLLKDPKQGKPVFFSKLGARVWEYVYTAAKSEKLQAQMLRSIVLPPLAIVRHPEDSAALSFPALFEKFDAETQKLTLDHLASVIQTCVDKELLDRAPVHKLLHYYTLVSSPERLQEVMNVTREGFLRLASTKSGVEAMTALSGFATAKQRKTLIKELKRHVVSMAKNAVDCVFVLRLLCTVDDTRLLREDVLQPLLADTRGLVADPYGQLTVLQLLEDSADFSRYLPPYYRRLLELPSPTSLKPLNVRLSELRGPVLGALEATFMKLAKNPEEDGGTATALADSDHEGNDDESSGERERPRQQHLQVSRKPEFTLSDWFSDPKASRVLTKLFHQSTNSDVFSALVDYLLEDQRAALAYLDHPQVQRFLSGLAKQMELSTTESSPAGDVLSLGYPQAPKAQVWESFLTSMWKRLLKPQLVSILPTRGVFVLSDVLEAARRLALKELEDDIIRSLDSDVLSDARAKLLEKGNNSVGLEILASKRFLETTKPRM